MPDGPLTALVGPTAMGKTEAAIALALRSGSEIVSVDSMLIYRGMDVGTAKPTPAQRSTVPHHLLDLAEPSEAFSVAWYQHAAHRVLEGLDARGVEPLLVGGSGLYFRACVDDLRFPSTDPGMRADLETEAEALGASNLHSRLQALDPVAAAKIEPANIRRTVRALEVAGSTGRRFSSFATSWERYDPQRVRAAGIEMDRGMLRERIARRAEGMIEAGWVSEVAGLVERGYEGWLTATQAIGYAELARHLRGELPLEEALALTVKRTTQLARRQLAWFRRDPRVRWFTVGAGGAMDAIEPIARFLGSGE